MVRDILNYDPFNLVNSLLNEKPLNRHSMLRKALRQVETEADDIRWLPRCDIQEKEDCFIIEAEVPGISPEDIKVELVQNDILSISGERHLEHEKRGADFNLIERGSGFFRRQFMLPEIDPDKITATGSHGLLTITVMKKEKAQPRRIVVDAKDSE